jgi:hypothetical protein
MKYAMGAALALALGLGLTVSAQATGIKQNSMSSPNLQTGSTEQMQQGQTRKKRVAIRHQQKGKMAVAKLNRHNRTVLAQKQKPGKTRLATLKQRKGMQFAKLHQKPGKTRIASLNRHHRSQTVGVGSSTPKTGTNIMPQAPNSAGGTQNTQNQ